MKPRPLPFAAMSEQCRKIITGSVSRHASEYAAAIGLPCSAPQFEQDVIESIVLCVFYHLSPKYRDPRLKQTPIEMPVRTALSLDTLSNRAHNDAKAFARKGGAPKMLAFNMLIKRLAAAFEHATGRAAKVTWNEHRKEYGGKFLSLVEAVLPLVLECAESLGSRLPCPRSQRARGKYIFGITRAGRRG